MANELDTLKTVLQVAGQANYMSAMMSAATATDTLARRVRQSNRDMLDSSALYFDETARRWRDAETGRFAKIAGQGFGQQLAVVTALATVLAAEIAMLTQVARVAAGAYRQAAEAFSEYEAVMKDVELQSGATAAQMEQMRAATLSRDLSDMGIAAKGAAEGYRRLSSEGFSVSEMQMMNLPITQAALVLGLDQAETTKLMLNLMRQYNLEAADMTMIADNLVGALNSTSLQGDEVAAALRYMGVTAGGLNWTLAETLAIADPLVGALGNAEMAGVYFREMMNLLKDPTNEAAAAFAAAGLNVADFRKHSQSAGDFLTWLQGGLWDTSLIAQAFGNRAADAAQILLNVEVPALRQNTAAINEMGVAQKNAEEKTKTQQGSVKALAAAYENMKVRLGEAVQMITKDYLGGVKLVVDAINQYLEGWREQLRKTDGKQLETRDIVLQVAEQLIYASARIAIMAIQVSRAMAIQAAQVGVLVHGYYVLKLAINELQYAYRWWIGDKTGMTEMSAEMDKTKKTIMEINKGIAESLKWGLGGGASAAIKDIEKAEEELLSRVRKMRDEQIKREQADAAKAKTPAGQHAQPGGQAEPDKADPNKALEYRLNQLKQMRNALEIWVGKAKASVSEPLEEAAIEIAYREKDWQLLVQMEALTRQMSASEQDKWAATVARAEAEVRILEARKRMNEEAMRQNEQERKKNETHFAEMARRHQAVNDAVQMVIGGRLSELVQDQIKRLGAMGDGSKGWLAGIRPAGHNKIVLELRSTGELTDRQVAQVQNHLIGIIKQAPAGAPL